MFVLFLQNPHDDNLMVTNCLNHNLDMFGIAQILDGKTLFFFQISIVKTLI